MVRPVMGSRELDIVAPGKPGEQKLTKLRAGSDIVNAEVIEQVVTALGFRAGRTGWRRCTPGSVRIDEVQDFLLQMEGAHQIESVGVRPVDDLRDKLFDLGSRLGFPIGKHAIKFLRDSCHACKVDLVLGGVNPADSDRSQSMQQRGSLGSSSVIDPLHSA